MLDQTDVALLRRQLRSWNQRADEAARRSQEANRDLRSAEREIGNLESLIRAAEGTEREARCFG